VASTEERITGDVYGDGCTLSCPPGQHCPCIHSNNRWRDLINVPAYGSVRLWMRFNASDPRSKNPFYGKTLFHCHFLAHEDEGMMANVLLTENVGRDEGRLDRAGHIIAPQPNVQSEDNKHAAAPMEAQQLNLRGVQSGRRRAGKRLRGTSGKFL